MEKQMSRLDHWALRALLWLAVLATAPLYLACLYRMGERWGRQLPAGDDLRFWLPIVVPLTAFSYTTMSSLSWWHSTEERPYLLGRTGWWFLMVFAIALSLMAGVFGSPHHDIAALLLAAMLTAMGVLGLWLLPPALSPQLLLTLRPKSGSCSGRELTSPSSATDQGREDGRALPGAAR
ncbi:hypothetical protein ABT160_24565 [Streptomyces sp. NPDC001941]|uniref:hypothetical protein n=1 Tax=Streptomyces sp. NPDC001941 TaxID=3154659 RepID=UPI00332B3E97